jgi:hypothetical protein
MKKSIRTSALMFALTFVAATTMRAEVMGTVSVTLKFLRFTA